MRLLVAMSWLPPDDECPASADGIRLKIMNTMTATVGPPHLRTIRAMTAATRANTAVQNQVRTSATWPYALIRLAGLIASDSGDPLTSDAESGISSSAHTDHTSADEAAIRMAR